MIGTPFIRIAFLANQSQALSFSLTEKVTFFLFCPLQAHPGISVILLDKFLH